MTLGPEGTPSDPTWPYGVQPPPQQPPPPPQPQHVVPCGYPGPPTGFHAPFGVHPIKGVPYSDKSKATAGLLQLLLPLVSVCGVGRLYAGHTAIGIIQLLGVFVAWFFSFFLVGIPFLIGFWLWSVIDGIVMLAGDTKDGDGRLLR